MLAEADKFKEQDERIKRKVEAKNALESFCVQMKNTIHDENLRAAFTED